MEFSSFTINPISYKQFVELYIFSAPFVQCFRLTDLRSRTNFVPQLWIDPNRAGIWEYVHCSRIQGGSFLEEITLRLIFLAKPGNTDWQLLGENSMMMYVRGRRGGRESTSFANAADNEIFATFHVGKGRSFYREFSFTRKNCCFCCKCTATLVFLQ